MQVYTPFEVYLGFGLMALYLAMAIGWVSHVIWTIYYLTGSGVTVGPAILAAIGVFMAPLGAIHGWIVILS